LFYSRGFQNGQMQLRKYTLNGRPKFKLILLYGYGPENGQSTRQACCAASSRRGHPEPSPKVRKGEGLIGLPLFFAASHSLLAGID
jgi:hypothetical protein